MFCSFIVTRCIVISSFTVASETKYVTHDTFRHNYITNNYREKRKGELEREVIWSWESRERHGGKGIKLRKKCREQTERKEVERQREG